MKSEMEQKLDYLNKLLKTAQNPKILLEEMRLVSEKAFDLQDELMQILNKIEETETNINTIQNAFSTRETVWDLVNKIALREKELIDSHSSRSAFKAHQKERSKSQKENASSNECVCNHNGTDKSCEHDADCSCHSHQCSCCH